jgi:tetratricopeptide (TPR) repeat protein/cell division protein FtsB
MRFLAPTFLIVCCWIQCLAQKKTDSLLRLLPNQRQDTSKVLLLADIAFSYYSHNPETGNKYATESLHLAEELNYERGKLKAYNSLGVLKWSLGDFKEAIEYYKQSLTIAEKLKDEKRAGAIYNNLAMIYSSMGDYDEALLFYQKSLRIDEKSGDSIGITSSLNNIGLNYIDMERYDEGIDALTKALAVYKREGAKERYARTLGNIGLGYKKQKLYTSALNYFSEGEKIYTELGPSQGASILYHNLAGTYFSLGKYDLSRKYFLQGLKIAKERGMKEQTSAFYHSLSKLDSLLGNYRSAYLYYLHYDSLQSVIFENNHTLELNKFKVQYEVKEKETENELLRTQAALHKAQFNEQRMVLAGAIGLIVLAVPLALVFYRNYRIKSSVNSSLKKLNAQIVLQREELKVANEEISSINENLENLVKQRSDHIESQKRQLTEYAFFNSHKVRGPLTSILGIINLMKMNPDLIKSDNLIEKLEEASHKMDTTIREINVILDDQEKTGDPLE